MKKRKNAGRSSSSEGCSEWKGRWFESQGYYLNLLKSVLDWIPVSDKSWINCFLQV